MKGNMHQAKSSKEMQNMDKIVLIIKYVVNIKASYTCMYIFICVDYYFSQVIKKTN